MGCRRVVHQPRRHAANPLLSSGAFGDYADAHGFQQPHVCHDVAAGVWRMWVAAYDRFESPPGSGPADRCYGLYFESQDGIEWDAPELDVCFRPEGRFVPRNVFWALPDRSVHISVCALPEEGGWWGRGRRYAMIYHCTRLGRDPGNDALPGGGMELRIAFSADGIRFADQQENPVFIGQSDCINSLIYHPQRRVFMLYRRPAVHAGHIRRISYSESVDLVSWSQPTTVLVPDEMDTEEHELGHFYGLAPCVYQGVTFGLLHCLYSTNPFAETKPRKHMSTDVQLCWSSDGKEFARHPRRPVFLETGPVGSCDWAQISPGSVVECEDEIRIYYQGSEQLHAPMGGASHVCLATLPRDRWVSIEAPVDGYGVTRPFSCPGGRLHLNARLLAPGGAIEVAARRGDGVHDGEWLPTHDFGTEGAAFEAADSLSTPCLAPFDGLRGRTLRLHFKLRAAELFSFWFE